ncbi:Enhancer of polycomb-like protein 1 [Armadillidium nasatum]|uniref:Enhancer of polycomb-like protein n=1 Tax=Armadillidium nasatum TaxID=96803 RepID=A0A5N5SJ48_9CRUS|nr:Enhancer of polycomb-like protein 1 [Armadillidium nasatum]
MKEHHLQQAIFHHRVIPVPEVYSTENEERGSITYDSLYPPSYKAPRQMIHIHPFSADQDIPDYDLDSEDDEWLKQHTTKGDLLPLDPNQFEEMMDRLEKASGLKAVTLQEAKLLLKDDDDLITAVYDYWLNKRLRLQHPLIPQVKSEKGVGSAPTDPYVAFRKRTEKMQTRKNRKNDETSFEKMLKLRRDLQRAVTLVEMVKRREKSKRELLHLNIELCEKRFEMEDFNGAIINEISAQRLNQQLSRPAFTPLTPNHKVGMSDLEGGGIGTGSSNMWLKVPPVSRSSKEENKRERRPYKKKRKHHQQISVSSSSSSTTGVSSAMASEDEVASHSEAEEDLGVDGYYTFRRKPLVKYHPVSESCTLTNYYIFNVILRFDIATVSYVSYIISYIIMNIGEPRESFPKVEEKLPKYSKEKSKQFFITSLSHPTERFIGFARRRIGRGGRMWLDRIHHPLEDLRIKSDIIDEGPNGLKSSTDLVNDIKLDWPHYHPTLSTLADTSEDSEDAEVDVETVSGVPPSPCLSEGISHSSSSTHLLGEDGSAGIGRGVKEGASSLGGGLPSSFYMTAEMLDGSQEGVLTDLQVTLPPLEDIDLLSVVEDKNFSSGLLLTNSKTTNGNNGLSNSKSALVTQKLLTWTNENLSTSEDNSNSLISNGPSSKSIDSLKCPKVTPVLFPET